MHKASIGSPTRAAFRVFLYLLSILGTLAAFSVCMPTRVVRRQVLVFLHHRTICRVAGIRVEVRGEMSQAHPTLFVCNHASYFDIPVIGSLIPGCFVAKAEVANWPVFGTLAKLQRTVFIERNARRAASHRNELQERLEHGDNLILFPEGTSSDGNRVLPFKSSLFAIAETPVDGRALTVQAVSVAYTKLDGMPMGRYLRPFFAWYGDMELAGHLWQALGLGSATVVVEFHPPATIADFGSRKALSEHCQRQAAAGVAAAIADRPIAVGGPVEEGVAA